MQSCGSLNTCDCCAFHSPDLRDNYSSSSWDGRILNGTGLYCRMGPYELIQQDFLPENQLESGNHYLVKFKYFVFQEDADDGSTLNFMIAKSRVKYKRKGREATEPVANICEDGATWLIPRNTDYKEYKTLFNDIVTVESYNIEEFTTEQWVEESFIFQMPEQGIDKYNWFTIDVHEDGSCTDGMCNPFVYLDDIEIYEVDYCNDDDPCSVTDGNIYPTQAYKPWGAEQLNWVVGNLDNVYEAKNITVRNYGGQIVRILPDRNCLNGIKYINWNGKSAGNNPVAEGRYSISAEFANDCGTIEYTSGFFRVYHIPYNPSLPETVPCNNCDSTASLLRRRA